MVESVAHDINELSASGWSPMGRTLAARFATGTFVVGLDFVGAIGAAAEEANHHPEIALTYTTVDIYLRSHDVGRLTQRDVELARRINELAGDRSIRPDLSGPLVTEAVLDSSDPSQIGAFWSVVLTGGPDAVDDDVVVDPITGRVVLRFQTTDPHEAPRQRFHLDVYVSPQSFDERIETAVAAGGTVIDTANAPRFTVLADADGNRACICTLLETA